MNDLKKTLSYIIPILLVVSIALNIVQCHDLRNTETKTTIVEKHDTVTVSDTIEIDKPMPAEVKVTTKYVKVPVETIKIDTLYAEIPKTEKIYKQDSLYECQVSGVEPNLDYIKVFPKTTIITNEKIITNTVKRRQHVGFGVQTGVGYGVFKKELDMYVGLGVNFNF